MANYSADERRQMAANGQAMKDGSYPIANAADLQNAIHAVGRGGADHDAIRKHIIGRAKALGKSSMIPDTWGADGSLSDGGGDGGGGSARTDTPYMRSFVLEDISIRAGGDGRTVDAYAAVFDTPAAVRDQDGEYEEIIDPAAFNRAIDHAQRSGHKIPVLFNHGMTLYGTPSEIDTAPIGVTEEIRADRRGLFTRARYATSPRADSILEAIREGSISAYSFQGSFKQSQPRVPRGGFRRNGDTLPTVRRTESTLREYGPTTFPAYKEAAIVAVRAEQAIALLGSLHPTELARLVSILGTPSDDGPAAGDPPEKHSTRFLREEMVARRRQFLIRHGGDHA